jgi:hypothetical protein
MRLAGRSGQPGGNWRPGAPPVATLRQVRGGIFSAGPACGATWRATGPSARAAAETLPPDRARARLRTARSASSMVVRFQAQQVGHRARRAARSPVRPRCWRAARVAPTTRSSASTANSAPARGPAPAPPPCGRGKLAVEQVGLDLAGHLGHRGADQTGHRVGQVGAGGRDVDHRQQVALWPVDRGRGAGQPDVAGQEVLVAVDGHGAPSARQVPMPLVPACGLGPDGAGPQARGFKAVVVAGVAAAVHRDALGIGQHHAGPSPPTTWNSRSRCGAAVGSSAPSRSRASASSCAVTRSSRHARGRGAGRAGCADRAHEAATADRAACPAASAAATAASCSRVCRPMRFPPPVGR